MRKTRRPLKADGSNVRYITAKSGRYFPLPESPPDDPPDDPPDVPPLLPVSLLLLPVSVVLLVDCSPEPGFCVLVSVVFCVVFLSAIVRLREKGYS